MRIIGSGGWLLLNSKWLLVILVALMIGLLSSCNQNEQFSSSEEDVENIENVEEVDQDANNAIESDEMTSIQEKNRENESIDSLPFDERLHEQGYEIIDDLPPGFPIEMPYHWVFVEDETDDIANDEFKGTFCFDLPLEKEQIATYFEHTMITDVEQDDTTQFTIDYGYGEIEGMLKYFNDDYDNTCAKMVFAFKNDISEEHMAFGEDPATMISEEELALEKELMKQNEGDEESTVQQSRERLLVDDYEEKLNHLLGSDYSEDIDHDDFLSVREDIKNGEVHMLNLTHGYPKIFPYEWYLVKMEENLSGSGWTGTFCTDAPLMNTVIKHHDMLGQYAADINDYNINMPPKLNEENYVEFSFNDQYGTGSWHGSSLFSNDEADPFHMYKCAHVAMEFSSELLP